MRSLEPSFTDAMLNYMAAEFGAAPVVAQLDPRGARGLVDGAGVLTRLPSARGAHRGRGGDRPPLRPRPGGRPPPRESNMFWGIEKLEENPYWWRADVEELCFDLQMTEPEDLTERVPPVMRQWWDVDKVAESDVFVAICKPPGMFVRTDDDGLWEKSPHNFVHVAHQRYEMASKDEPRQRGICHRLDLNTSGVQIFGNSWEAFQHFATQNTAHRMQKEYLTLVHGRLGGPDEPNVGVIDVPMKKWQDMTRREFGSVVCANREGSPAISKYRVLRQWKVPAKGATRFWGEDRWFSLVQMRIMTGRTHQIRVHMAFLGHPLVCDEKYNPWNVEKDMVLVPRIFLHCTRMQFEDMDGSMFTASSDLSPDLQVGLHRLHELSELSSGVPVEAEAAPTATATAGVGFPGFQWLLEHTKAAEPEEFAPPEGGFEDRAIAHTGYNGQDVEKATCSLVRRDSRSALSWKLTEVDASDGPSAVADLLARGLEANWGPRVLWTPSGARELQREFRSVVAAAAEDLQEPLPQELGKQWGAHGYRWAWAHDGENENGWFRLHAGGVLTTIWGNGTWELLERNSTELLLVTFSSVEHALRFQDGGSAAGASFDMVSKRRLNTQPGLGDDIRRGCHVEALDPGAPPCGTTRGWPQRADGSAVGGA